MEEYKSILDQEKERFDKSYNNFSESEITKENLFYNKMNYKILEKIKSNTSKLVWFLVVIPYVVIIAYGFYLWVTVYH